MNPGLALTPFWTILPCFEQVNQTWARDAMKNQHLVSGELQKNMNKLEMWKKWYENKIKKCFHKKKKNKKKHRISISYKLEPGIWSRDMGQRIPCFDMCQLIITWMSNIREVHSKPRLHVSVKLLFGLWPPCFSLPIAELRFPCHRNILM